MDADKAKPAPPCTERVENIEHSNISLKLLLLRLQFRGHVIIAAGTLRLVI